MHNSRAPKNGDQLEIQFWYVNANLQTSHDHPFSIFFLYTGPHDTGEVLLPAGVEMIMPGDDAKMTVTLITPIAMDNNLKFAIREGGRTVGAGVVTKIIE